MEILGDLETQTRGDCCSATDRLELHVVRRVIGLELSLAARGRGTG